MVSMSISYVMLAIIVGSVALYVGVVIATQPAPSDTSAIKSFKTKVHEMYCWAQTILYCVGMTNVLVWTLLVDIEWLIIINQHFFTF